MNSCQNQQQIGNVNNNNNNPCHFNNMTHGRNNVNVNNINHSSNGYSHRLAHVPAAVTTAANNTHANATAQNMPFVDNNSSNSSSNSSNGSNGSSHHSSHSHSSSHHLKQHQQQPYVMYSQYGSHSMRHIQQQQSTTTTTMMQQQQQPIPPPTTTTTIHHHQQQQAQTQAQQQQAQSTAYNRNHFVSPAMSHGSPSNMSFSDAQSSNCHTASISCYVYLHVFC